MDGGVRGESVGHGGTLGGIDLLDILAPRVHTGQIVFANAMRRSIRAIAPELFGQLDFGADDVFLHPLAVAAVSSGTRRRWEAGAMLREAFAGCESRSARVQRGPVLVARPVALFEQAVFGSPHRLQSVEASARRHRRAVDDALHVLATVWPELSALINDTIRYLVLFEQPCQNSFASRATHGVAYLNVALGSSVAFFIEDVAHQCGHGLFSSAWEGGEALILVDRDTEMTTATGAVGDHRTLEVALHGAITLALMLEALDRYIESGSHWSDRAEARARLTFALTRLGLDIGPLSGCAALTSAGAALFDAVIATYHRMLVRYRADVMRSDFTGQGYNFDYEVFLAHNCDLAHRAPGPLEVQGA